MASHSSPEEPGPAGRRTHLRLIEGAGANAAAPARRARSARQARLPATIRSRSAPDVEWGWGTGIVPTYIPAHSLDENAHRLVKMIWGHAAADWAYCLAHDLMAEFPDSDRPSVRAGWLAGVMTATGIEIGERDDADRWRDVIADITAMTGVVGSTALRRWRDLRRLGLDRPGNPPSWWQHPDS